MTDLAAIWASERSARAERAAAAVAAGRATPEQSARDARLCACIARVIADGFTGPDRSRMSDAAINDYFDAADLARAVVRTAALDRIGNPSTDRQVDAARLARVQALAEIARRTGSAIAIAQAGCWVAHRLEQAGWPGAIPLTFDPGLPPHNWRLPVAQAHAA